MSLLADNPFAARADLARAVRALWAPVQARLSPGGARAQIGTGGADRAVAELEGFARPLFGLAPLAAGGGAVDWAPVLRGIAAGTDPAHPEYWGEAGHGDQRLVEMAAIASALALAPEQLWQPLSPQVRGNLAAWLARANRVGFPENNWLWFRVLVNDALARVGAPGVAPTLLEAALDRVESFYLGDGWYADGETRRRDHYVGFALHFYGLIHARLAGDRDPARAARLRARAARFAQDFAGFFADDGAALPFGRSLTYRFAQGAFWGALAFAGVEALPWGVVKGLLLRNLRWWARQPITDAAGLLTVGHRYPNPLVAEGYVSPGSPYWAMKAFLPLALAGDHPFWAAAEAPLPPRAPVQALPHAGMILCRQGGQVVALASGQEEPRVRHGPEKYAKLAYSTAAGFGLATGGKGLAHAAPDGALALSEDEQTWRTRSGCVRAWFEGSALRSRWTAGGGVEVETWLLPRPPWHLRLHRVRCDRALATAEGGFPADADAAPALIEGAGRAAAVAGGGSGICDLHGARRGELLATAPDSHVLFPRAVVPILRGRLPAGEHWLACAVLLANDAEIWARAWPAPPSLAEALTELRAACPDPAEAPPAELPPTALPPTDR